MQSCVPAPVLPRRLSRPATPTQTPPDAPCPMPSRSPELELYTQPWLPAPGHYLPVPVRRNLDWALRPCDCRPPVAADTASRMSPQESSALENLPCHSAA